MSLVFNIWVEPYDPKKEKDINKYLVEVVAEKTFNDGYDCYNMNFVNPEFSGKYGNFMLTKRGGVWHFDDQGGVQLTAIKWNTIATLESLGE